MLVLGLLGCSPLDAESAFLLDTLQSADRPFADRPVELAAKYAKMDADRYDFMRGTLPVFHARIARPGDRTDTSFLGEAAEFGILRFGDPHPENLSTCLDPQGVQSVQIIDLDAAAYGPWLVDLRRAALGMAVLTDALPDCDCTESATRALAEGYSDAIHGEVRAPGAILTALLQRAASEGEEREKLLEWTVEDGFLYDAAPDPDGAVLLRAEGEREHVEALLSGLDVRVLDIAAREGAGVASLPAERFAVLFDHGQEGRDDDDLLELREVLDPSTVPGISSPSRFRNGAARIDGARELWGSVDADALASAIQEGPRTWKTLGLSSWSRGVDHEDIRADWLAGDLRSQDLDDLARDLGARIAIGHSNAETASGDDPQPILAEAVHDGLADELVEHARADLATLDADYERFHALLDRFGADLGVSGLAMEAR